MSDKDINNDLNIKIYQTYYLKEHLDNLEPEFTPLDVSNNPVNDHYEIEYLKDIFLSEEFKKHSYTGLLSWKFNQKTNLHAKEVFEFIDRNPGYDLYILSPYPHIADNHYNVWEQGDLNHPGLSTAADELFRAAELPFRTSSTGRNDLDSMSWCNYWVGNSTFWNIYGEILQKLLTAIAAMPEDEASRYYDTTTYFGIKNTPMFPFIFERIISTMLKHSPSFSYISYHDTLRANK